MKIVITEEQKKKLFIPRKFNKDDHRWMDHNNSQPIVDGVRINQYDEEGNRQGYWEHYHDNGRLYKKGSYKDGEKDGRWEGYYDNGQLIYKGRYVDGKREGYWEFYWSNGSLNRKGNYVDDEKEGYWERYWDNGNLESKGNYKNGDKVGYWEYYYSNGRFSSKGVYKNGKFFNNLTESEKKKLFIPRKFNKDDSRYDDWNNKQPIKDGVRIKQYDYEGRKQGYWEEYYSNGQLFSKGNYKDDKQDGYWEYYYPNSKIMSKGNFINGEKDGYWEDYYDNGQLMSKNYYENGKRVKNLTESEKKKLFIPRKFNKDDHRWMDHNKSQPMKDGVRINQYDENGLKQGYWEEYFSSGQLEGKGNYKDDKVDGYWEFYWSNGQLSTKGNYIDGDMDGYWVSYWSDGGIMSKGYYENGKRVKNLTESISPSEATTNIGSFKTLEDGKRGVAFITLKDNNPSVNRYISESIKRNDFGFILVKENPYNGIIVFKKEYRPQAEELYKIAMKYGGILSYKATYEETKRIGEILEYHPEDIEAHLKQKYGSKNINEGTSYEYKLDPLYSDPNNRQIIYEFTGKDNINFEVVFTNIGDNYWEREYRTNKNGLGVINTNDVYNILETVTKITLDFIETYQPETIYILHISNKKEKMMGIDTVKQPTKRALLNKKFLSPAINKLDNYYYKLIGSKSVISKI